MAFEHLSEPFPIPKQLNKVIRYLSKLYSDVRFEEWWNTEPCLSKVYYKIIYSTYNIGTLYEDRNTDNVFLVLNTVVQEYEWDRGYDKALTIGCDIAVKWLECIPVFHLESNGMILFKVTREDIPNV